MTKTLASIYWEPCHATRPLYSGVFDIPAVKRGDPPALLTVTDHVQLEKLPYLLGGGQQPTTIFGEHIAACLLKEWTTNALGMTPECAPGIWIVRDVLPVLSEKKDEVGVPVVDPVSKMPQFRAATAEEREAMWKEDLESAIARQAKWGEYLIQQGDMYASDPEGKKVILIRDLHRNAAKHYGREREWLHELKDGDRKACPFCQKSIAPSVIKCPHCSEIVDRQKYAELTGNSHPTPPMKPAGRERVSA